MTAIIINLNCDRICRYQHGLDHYKIMPALVRCLGLLLMLFGHEYVLCCSGVLADETDKAASIVANPKSTGVAQVVTEDKKLSVEEAYKAVEKHFPSARRISEDIKAIDIISGHYIGNYQDPIPLAGNDLYLFPDRTYIYLHWADVMPIEICDRGTWEYQDGFTVLKTDGTIKHYIRPLDHVYLPVTVSGKQSATDSSKENNKPNNHSSDGGQNAPKSVAQKTEKFLLLGIDFTLLKHEKLLLTTAFLKKECISSKEAKARKDAVLRLERE